MTADENAHRGRAHLRLTYSGIPPTAGWYEHGGNLEPGTAVVRNDTDQAERILTHEEWEALAHGPS